MTLGAGIMYGPRELGADGSLSADADRRITDRARVVSEGMSDVVVLPGDASKEDRLDGEKMLFAAGAHGGLRVTNDETRMQCVPGSIFTRKVVIDASCKFEGAHFKSSDGSNNEPLLVYVIDPGATVLFIGCVFEKMSHHTTAFVNIADGAKASFIGCKFLPVMDKAGTVVNNLGVAANAGIIGCSDKTGVGAVHVNVTSIFETT